MKGTQGLGNSLSRAAILVTAAISLALTACSSGGGGGDDYDSAWVGDIETDVSISGSVGDGPTVNATVTIRKKNGDELKSFRSDASASYSIGLSVSERHFPLLVDATGGTDVVTNAAPDFVLRSVVLSAGDQVTANVNPFSTLAFELAKDLNGGVTRNNLLAAEEIVATSMNSGLSTLVASGTIQTPIDSSNVAEIVKASETMAEIVRRTRDAMQSAGKEVSADKIIEAVGSDLVDGVIEGNGGRRADERIAAVATIASAEVLLEAMRNELRVNGADATDAMRAAVLEVVPEGAEPGMDELGVTGQMIEQARISLIAAYEITNDPAVYSLLQSLDGLHDGMGPAEAKTVIPADYRSSLKGLKHMTAGGDRALVAAVNAAARRGNPASAPVNRAPVISGKPKTSIRAGERYSFSPVVSDLDGDPLTFSISGRPAWADFDKTTGRLYGTPTDADAGAYDGIIITVSDGELSSDVGPFSITVQSDNVGPTISGTPRKSVGSGERYSFKPSVTDPDSNVFSFEISGKPAWADFDVLTGHLSGTPELGDVGVYRNIVISVSDGKASASLSAFSIEVVDSRSAAPGNRAPVISGQPKTSIRAGERYNFNPVASDLDGDPLTFSIAGRPAWANFDKTTGRLYGTPTDADAGSYDGIIITVSDGELSSDVGPFTITVQSDNVGPTISGTPRKTVGSGERYSFKPSVTDPDSNVFRFDISGKPAWANFDVLTGRLYGTPGLADVGVYRNIVISVSDGKASASLPAFSIEVVDSRSATGSETLTWTPPTENEDGSALVNLAGYRVYWGLNGEPLSNSARIDNPSVTRYIVENLAPGDYEFAVTAVNSRGVESRFSNIKAKTIE